MFYVRISHSFDVKISNGYFSVKNECILHYLNACTYFLGYVNLHFLHFTFLEAFFEELTFHNCNNIKDLFS